MSPWNCKNIIDRWKQHRFLNYQFLNKKTTFSFFLQRLCFLQHKNTTTWLHLLFYSSPTDAMMLLETPLYVFNRERFSCQVNLKILYLHVPKINEETLLQKLKEFNRFELPILFFCVWDSWDSWSAASCIRSLL